MSGQNHQQVPSVWGSTILGQVHWEVVLPTMSNAPCYLLNETGMRLWKSQVMILGGKLHDSQNA